MKFYLDYIRTETILKKTKRDFLEELSKKIRLALKTVLDYFQSNKTLRLAKDYLTELDNQQRVDYQHAIVVRATTSVQTTFRTKAFFISTRTPITRTLVIKYITIIKSNEVVVCYNCGKKDYIRKNCIVCD